MIQVDTFIYLQFLSLAGVITDAVGSVLKAKFTLKIAKPVQISTTTVKAGKVNTNYTATLKAKDGVKAYTWSVDGVVAACIQALG